MKEYWSKLVKLLLRANEIVSCFNAYLAALRKSEALRTFFGLLLNLKID